MPRGVRVGGWRFRAGLVPSIAAAAFIAVTLSLGSWQTRRAEEKAEIARKLDEGTQGAVLPVPSAVLPARSIELRRVSVRGRFVGRSTFFLDNKVLRGIAGYRVFTPLAIEGGDVHVLVERGWIAAGDRSRLPSVPTPEGALRLEGVTVIPSLRFLELAPEQASGPLRQNLVIEREQARLGIKLQPFVIEQTSDTGDGLDRARDRPDPGVDRHRSYALQWYSFAVLAAIFYVVLNFRREPSQGG